VAFFEYEYEYRPPGRTEYEYEVRFWGDDVFAFFVLVLVLEFCPLGRRFAGVAIFVARAFQPEHITVRF